ncbi:glutamine--fructose-6-phosphate transaminase (isomerizing) [Chrysiogenes arsenatis]|uniref:glutamine--fructose-6-phosphate transaminase (isomerizing) n=1 Tax=Chrysiogenes arsenatis TaxID=309797 RepID=UPI0003F84D25|nr:glutamine--fructose-6-phosphate transaminase (isomerizing) [Chrysiogenes arsenatis]
MCGIVGYTGKRAAMPIILEGLKKLEYRGYDSAGISTLHHNELTHVKALGKLIALEEQLAQEPLAGSIGIGHTRWATHGKPSVPNAHPHVVGTTAIVHNGIIENYKSLRTELEAHGSQFLSETDTETVAHLLHVHRRETLLETLFAILPMIRGAYSIAAIDTRDPHTLVCVKQESPLVIGLGKNENFVASDIPALLAHTRDFIFLEDGDVAAITPESVSIYHHGQPVERPIKTVSWSPSAAEKGGYKHFMLKEIHEQPRALRDTLRGKFDGKTLQLSDLALTPQEVASIRRIQLVACGTSWHAGLVGKYYLEQIARIPVEVDIASEYRYRTKVVDSSTLVVPITQSGETADTLAALKDAKREGAKVITVCNVVDSSIVRESHGVLYTNAGPEIGVASTKAFTTQLAALYLLALFIAQEQKRLDSAAIAEHIAQLEALPAVIETVLEREEEYKNFAHTFHDYPNFLFLGRSFNFPIALEGALKLKEISYIHAEGYASGEMKHGPIALIDAQMPVVVVATASAVYDKLVSNVEEVAARDGIVVALVNDADTSWGKKAHTVFRVPEVPEMLSPIVNAVPMQFIAYYVADFKGCDVDQPRNLAKSVTVE